MIKLPAISGDQCIRALEKVGFVSMRQSGSHVIMRRNNPFGRTSVPKHRTLKPGTLRGIIRDAGLSVEEFIELL
jgi:predicted RNA binding protein YcfA (HicA-like mRNA interferase family)